MAKQNRTPVQLSPSFHEWLKKIQKEIMLSRGEHKSLPDISEEMLKYPAIQEIERNLVRKNNLKMDIKIKLDRRIFR